MSLDSPGQLQEAARPYQGRDPVFRLEREWLVLEQGAIAAALPGWRDRHAPLRRFASGRRLLCFLNTAVSGETDAPLLALLCLAREERLAGRLVLQAILPALKAQAERIAYEPGRREEVWELLLFYAWEAICSYPLSRRAHVAANLVLQVLHDTTRELNRPGSEHEAPFPPDKLDQLPPRAGFEHAQGRAPRSPNVAVIRAVAARALGKRDAQLILRTRVDGISLRLAADALGVSYHAARQRRQRAEQRLRQLLDAHADVSKTPLSDLTPPASPSFSPSPVADADRSPHPRDRDRRAAPCAA